MTYYNHLTFSKSQENSSILVSFKDETLSFKAVYYTKGKSHDVETSTSPFEEFNQWLKTKPMDWHAKKFEIYKQSIKDFEEYNDVRTLLEVLNKLVIELYDDDTLVSIKDWMMKPTSPVKIPIKQQNNYPSETTYNYEDYLNLVVYSLGLRFIAPIWGMISQRLHTEYKEAKEIYSFEILHGTCMSTRTDKFGNVIEVCQAENRLRDFIVTNCVNAKMDTNVVLVAGLSEEDFYNSLFSMAVLRRITLGNFLLNTNYNLISSVYYFIGNKINSASISYGSEGVRIQMKKKPIQDSGGNEANSQSVLDVGFVRTKLYADEIAFLIHSIKDHPRLIQTIEPNLSMDLYHESMSTIEQMDTNYSHLAGLRQNMKPIQTVQLTLTKWVVHPAVNSVIFDHLELKDLIQLIGLVRAIYWQWGFPDMAAIISAIALPITSDNMYVQPSTYRKNIDPVLADQLNKTYDLGGVTKSEKRNMTPVGCIELINSGMSEFNWLLTLPDSWLEQDKLKHDHRHLILPNNPRNRIGELMLFLESKQTLEDNDFPSTTTTY